MTKSPLTVRLARREDALGIAQVHVNSWRSTYRGMIPADFLANLSVENRQRHWTQVLCEDSGPEFVYVAEDEQGRIAGFASGGPERTRHPNYKGELYAIYLLEEYQGQGLGQELFDAVSNRLWREDYNSFLLWVLTANKSARRFYEKNGGQFIVTQEFELGEATLLETGYGWTKLD